MIEKARIPLAAILLLSISACGTSTDNITQAESTNKITRAEYGDEWAFNVDEGELRCEHSNGGRAVTFYSPERNIVYGLNGPGQGLAKDLDPNVQMEDVWLEDANVIANLEAAGVYDPIDFTPRMNLSPFIERGLSICGE